MWFIRAKNKFTRTFVWSGIVALALFTFASYAAADAPSIQLTVDPTTPLFAVEKMVPGDTEASTVTIRNTGTVDFTYAVNVRKEAGSEKLFSALMLTVSDGATALFQSKLDNIHNVRLGDLAAGGVDTRTFTLQLPLIADDEYQNLSAEIAFDFVATATSGEGGTPPGDPGDNPPKDNPPKDNPPRDNPPKDNPPKDNPPGDNPPGSEDGTPTQPDDPTPTDPDDPDDPAIPDGGEQPDDPTDPDLTDDPGIPLPDTSSPWFNLLLLSGIFIVLSVLLLWVVIRVDRSKKWDV